MTPRAFSLIKNPSLYLDRAALHLNFHPYLSFRLTYRNHTARRSKSAVYAKVVCRKCGDGITEERRSHLDTSTAPVRFLFPPYVHSLVDVHVQRCLSNLPDPRRGSNEERSFNLGKVPRGERSHRPLWTLQ